MKQRAFLLAALMMTAPLSLQAASVESIVYTFEGKGNLTRAGKVEGLSFDLPLKNGDLFKIESESWIDFAFFYSLGLRVEGPSDILMRSVRSLSGLDMKVSGGNILIHAEDTGDSIDLLIETPHAEISVTEKVLAYVSIEPPDKTGKGGKTYLVVKKGRLDATVKASDSTLRLSENQKVEISGEAYIPAIVGADPVDIRPADRARTVFIASKDDGDETGF